MYPGFCIEFWIPRSSMYLVWHLCGNEMCVNWNTREMDPLWRHKPKEYARTSDTYVCLELQCVTTRRCFTCERAKSSRYIPFPEWQNTIFTLQCTCYNKTEKKCCIVSSPNSSIILSISCTRWLGRLEKKNALPIAARQHIASRMRQHLCRPFVDTLPGL